MIIELLISVVLAVLFGLALVFIETKTKTKNEDLENLQGFKNW